MSQLLELPAADEVPRSRVDDPATSSMAEDKLRKSGGMSRQRLMALQLLKEYPQYTTVGELCLGSYRLRATLFRRFADLRDLYCPPLAENREIKQCPVTGFAMQTWFLTERGEGILAGEKP